MAPDRIATAIDSLVTHLVPASEDDDEETAQARHDRCFGLVKSVIDNASSPGVSSDVNHASDLIKRKLIQTDPSLALRFSNLYSRLLSLPVLDKKWAILHLLHELSDSPDPNEPIPAPPIKPSAANYKEAIKKHSQERSKTSMLSSRFEEEQFKEAFQPDGLKQFPAQTREDGASPRAPHKRGGSLKSTLLAGDDHEYEPSESSLLRDLPFTLQGVSSTTLPFSKQDVLRLPATLPLPIVSLLHSLAEPSLLYRNLDAFCKTTTKGLLGQSLRSAVSHELRSYLSLIATLESEIRKALSTLEESPNSRGSIARAGVTLKRCVVWTREATMGLRLLSLLSEDSESKKGGQLISLIHGFSSSHGDPVVAAFAERLLSRFTVPFYDILRRWIYDGELLDPYQEFFVREKGPGQEKQKAGGGGGGGDNAWEDKYEIASDMIPSIMTEDFAQKVFLIGKSLHFIRHSCGDSLWVEDYSKAASKELRYGDTATLETWIDEAYKTTMRRLCGLMADKFRLFEHLQALKSYYLLGQGDFIALLMESLAANLDRPAGAQYRHTLTAQLEHAIRGSNAQYDSPEVLRRLDARMLQLSHGDIGWDCFTLEYKIDAPVDVVVTEWGNRQYLKVFNFLWRIKRVEFGLLSTWRKCMTGARGVLQNSDPAVTQTWKLTRGTLAEMIHFVGQLQYYILFEVIESSWGELQERIRKEDCTLDDIIKAHTRYLNDITHKGLLGPKRRVRQGGSAGDNDDSKQGSYLAQLSEILRFMLHYRDAVDGLYSWSVSEFTRREEAGIRSTTGSGRHDLAGGEDASASSAFLGSGDGRMPSTTSSEFPALQDRLKRLGSSFRTQLQMLLGDLAYQPDVDMRFLGVAMNFNDVYVPVKRRSKTQSQSQSQSQTQSATANSSSTQ